MPDVFDLSDLEHVLDDPELQDGFKLAQRFGKAVRNHYRGKPINPYAVIDAGATAIQAGLRELSDDERREALAETIQRLELIVGFLETIGRPAEGSA